MRNCKRLLAVIILTLFSLIVPVPAFAAGEMSFKEPMEITVKNDPSITGVSIDNQEFNIYHIFPVSRIDGSKYYFPDNISGYTTDEYIQLLEEFKKNGNNNENWIKTEGIKKIQEGIKKGWLMQISPVTGIATNETVTLDTQIETGYMISASIPSRAKIECGGYFMLVGKTVKNGTEIATTPPIFFSAFETSNNDAIPHQKTVYIKADSPSVTKEITNTSPILLGDNVDFKITGKVPNVSAFIDGYTYKITDTLGNGFKLSLPLDLTVKIGEQTLNSTQYNFTPNIANNSFDLSFNLQELITAGKANIGEPIIINYSAPMDKSANVSTAKYYNTAQLTYSNDPNISSSLGTTVVSNENTSKIHFFSININPTFPNIPITSSIQLKLKNEKGEYYKFNKEINVVSWVTDASQATVISCNKSDGTLSRFKGITLPNQATKYTIEEVSVPNGLNEFGKSDIWVRPSYQENTKVVNAIEYSKTSDFKDSKSINYTDNNTHATILEERTYTESSFFPTTGGIGTTIFFVGGAFLMITAGILLYRKKKINQ